MAGLTVSVDGKVQQWACAISPDATADPGLAATFTLQEHTADLRTDVLACASAVASHHVAAGDAAGVVHVLDGAQGTVCASIQPVREALGAAVAMQWARRAPVLAVGWDSGAVGLWHMDLAAWVGWLPCHWQSPCTALTWAPDDSCLYAGSADGVVNVWDTYVAHCARMAWLARTGAHPRRALACAAISHPPQKRRLDHPCGACCVRAHSGCCDSAVEVQLCACAAPGCCDPGRLERHAALHSRRCYCCC